MKAPNKAIPPCTDCDTQNRLFCSLSLEERAILAESQGRNFFKKGQTIFYEGNHPHGLYCIYSGKVKLVKMGENGKEQVVRLAGKGEILGYRAVLSNESYRATASALEDSYICLLSTERFFGLLDQNSGLSRGMMTLLSQDLKRSEQNLIDFTQKSVKERVAEALLLLKEKFGLENDRQTLKVVLSRKEIGDLVGITTETAIRTLSDLNKGGLIELKGKRIRLLDQGALSRLANIQE